MKEYCPKCEKEVEVIHAVCKKVMPVKGVDVEIDASIDTCSSCGHEIWINESVDENLRKAYNTYRKMEGLLLPEEIKAIREQYGLSQTAFARVLGLGDKTITRYENGSLQDEAQNNLILLARTYDNFVELFHKNKRKLSDDDIRRFETATHSSSTEMGSFIYEPTLEKANYIVQKDKNIVIVDFTLPEGVAV